MRHPITFILLCTALVGCSGSRRPGWSWSPPQTVPVTTPTTQDPNITFTDVTVPTPAPVASDPEPTGDGGLVTASPVSPASPNTLVTPVPSAADPRLIPVEPRTVPMPAQPEPVAVRPTPIPAPAQPTPAPASTGGSEIHQPMDLTALLAGANDPSRFREIKPVVTTTPGAADSTPPSSPNKPPVNPNVPSVGSTSPAVPARPAPVSVRPVPAAPENPRPRPNTGHGRPAVSPSPVPATPVVGAATEEVVAASVVQVNRSFITIDDILRPLAPKLAAIKAASEPSFRQQAAEFVAREVHTQITRRLVVEEAEKRLVDEQKRIVDKEVSQAHKDMLAAAGGSVTQLRQKLAREGMTVDEALTDYRRNVMFRLYLRHRFVPAIPVTRKMLWDYYCQNAAKFSSGRKVQMQLIAEPFNDFLAAGAGKPSATELAAAKNQARLVIEAAKARLDAGDDFAAVAKKYSRGVKAASGGTWPLMEAGSFRETEVEKAAFNLPTGKASKPIETPNGWYIVKAVQVIPGRVTRFEDAQEEIVETLRDRMYRDLTNEYFKDLLAKSHVISSPQFNKLAVDRAVTRWWKK